MQGTIKIPHQSVLKHKAGVREQAGRKIAVISISPRPVRLPRVGRQFDLSSREKEIEIETKPSFEQAQLR
jgi:hypothetical protein